MMIDHNGSKLHTELVPTDLAVDEAVRLAAMAFLRAQVLHAYQGRCSLCHLGHVELIDAAHIQSDAENGQPVVTNGIAMCKLHHATFDNRIVGIDADYRIYIREDILSEVDGPTLQHSIKALHGNKITLPSQRAAHPDRSLLDARFEQFSKAG